MVGYYALSALITDFSIYLTQLGVNEVVAPQLLREYGRSGSHAKVAVFYELPARLFCYVLPPLLAIGSLLIPSFVRLVLPQYVPGIEAAQITMWGIFFMAVHASVRSFLVAADKVNLILKFFGFLIPISAAAQYAVIKAGFGLEGVAWTAITTLAVLTSAELYIARRGCAHSHWGIAKYMGSLYFPLFAAFGMTMAVRCLDFGSVMPALVEAAAKCLLGVLLYVPVLLVYESRYSLLRLVRRSA
jgi:O-antigen/teichoic acid export membrane protein